MLQKARIQHVIAWENSKTLKKLFLTLYQPLAEQYLLNRAWSTGGLSVIEE